MSFSRVCALSFAVLLGLALQTARPAWANPLDAIDEDDRDALEALALYPDDVREHALQVASEPSLLQDLQKLQDSSQGAFRDLLNPYAQDDQEQLFELSRYPDLVADIAKGGPKSRSDLERIASDYPEDVRAGAVKQGLEHAAVIGRMHALLEDFDGRFNQLIHDLPDDKKQAFRSMLGAPEVLSILNEHARMTVLLGDAFDRDPRGLRDALSDLNLEVARRNAEEADDWKQSVDSDPDLRRDYDQAAADYQRDTGYSAYQAPATVVQVNVNPYPYWFGYPWWYPVSYTYYDPWYWWYPRHYWGGCGYYFGPRVAVYGGPVWRPFYPSYGFTSWYFTNGGHHAHYPYLSDRFVSFYERPVFVHNHVNYYNARTRVVKKFVYHTDRVVPASYFHGANKKDRVERFREFGKIAPEIDKAQLDTRKNEFAKDRGKRPGRDFAIREDASEDKAARDEVQKIVKKNPKNFPELAKIRDDEWKKAPEQGRTKREGLFEGGGKGKGDQAGPATQTLGSEAGAKGKGKGGQGGGSGQGLGQGSGGNQGENHKKGDSGKVSPFGGGQGSGSGQGGNAHGGGGNGSGAGKGNRGGDEGVTRSKQGGGQGGSGEGLGQGGGGHGGGQGGGGNGGGAGKGSSRERVEQQPSYQGVEPDTGHHSGGGGGGGNGGGGGGAGKHQNVDEGNGGGGNGGGGGGGNGGGGKRSYNEQPRAVEQPRTIEQPRYQAPPPRQEQQVHTQQQQGGGGGGGGGGGNAQHKKKQGQGDDDDDDGSGGGRRKH